MPKVGRVWKYFNVTDELRKKAACAFCKHDFSYKTTTTNLKSHLRLKHFLAYKKLSKENDTKASDVMTSELWNYFDKVPNSTKASCHFCYKLYSYKSTITNLKIHLERKHSDTVKIGDLKIDETTSNKDSVTTASDDDESINLDPDNELWGFYDKKPHNRAKCSMCGDQMKCDTETLYQHLKEKHSKISKNLEIKDNDENYTEVIYLEDQCESLKPEREKILTEMQPKAKPMKRRKSTRNEVIQCKEVYENSDDSEVENFGKYITGLLKGVPRVDSSKLQMEIVSLIMNTKLNLTTTTDMDCEVKEKSMEQPPNIEQQNQDGTAIFETPISSDLDTSKKEAPPTKRPRRRFSYREEYSFRVNLTENEEKEVENFGKYVISLLKTVPQTTTSAKLQMDIVNLIMTTRLQTLQKNAPVLTINGTIEIQNTNTDNTDIYYE